MVSTLLLSVKDEVSTLLQGLTGGGRGGGMSLDGLLSEGVKAGDIAESETVSVLSPVPRRSSEPSVGASVKVSV